MKEIEIARDIGRKVALNEIKIICPICDKEPPREGQLLSSIGDKEEILFCPGCHLEIELVVTK